MHLDLADGAGPRQADVLPALASVDGAVHTVADGHVAAGLGRSHPHVDHVRIARRHGHRADGASLEVVIRQVLPGESRVRRAPDAAAGRAHVERVGVRHVPGDRGDPSATAGADEPELDSIEGIGVLLLARCRCGGERDRKKNRCVPDGTVSTDHRRVVYAAARAPSGCYIRPHRERRARRPLRHLHRRRRQPEPRPGRLGGHHPGSGRRHGGDLRRSAEHDEQPDGAHGGDLGARSHLGAPSAVELYTDSQYLRQGITSWLARWRVQGWRRRDGGSVKNVDLWRRLEGLDRRHRVSWHWVKGHAGNEWNERVDALGQRRDRGPGRRGCRRAGFRGSRAAGQRADLPQGALRRPAWCVACRGGDACRHGRAVR